MKLIKAFLHRVRSAAVVDALTDAGFRNLVLQDVKGMLTPLSESERTYSAEAGLVIAEVRISLVCADAQVEKAVSIIRTYGRIGDQVCGWIYVSPVEQALPIGGPGV